VKAGMRLYVFKEGTSFIHPVTKEPLGKIEIPIGHIAITETTPDGWKGRIISGKPEEFAGANVKIPKSKIKILFYQGNLTWYLGDAYHQMLKESGRFELIDTNPDKRALNDILSEAKAKSADAILLLDSQESQDQVSLTQKLYWASDATLFSEKKATIDATIVKELRFQAGRFGPREAEVLLSYTVSAGATRLAVTDLDGNGEMEIVLVSGTTVRIYKPGADLKLLWELNIPMSGEIIWIEPFRPKNSARDALLITVQSGARVAAPPSASPDSIDPAAPTMAPQFGQPRIVSYLYELKEASLVQKWKFDDIFVRNIDNRLIGQEYIGASGYVGNVFQIDFIDGKFKRSENLKLPVRANIYNFQIMRSPEGAKGLLMWSEDGYLMLFDEQGIRMWVSKDPLGCGLLSFQKDSKIVMVDKGRWTVKDKLIMVGGEALAPKCKPLVGVTKSLGFSSSQIKSLWWNGLSVEERIFIDDIDGGVLDYAIIGDRMMVLAKPLFGIKAKNILKGENPVISMLFIYSLRGQ
jgi:hypothetical protein